MGAQATSSIGRTVSPSVASKNVAPFAFSLRARQNRRRRVPEQAHATTALRGRCRSRPMREHCLR